MVIDGAMYPDREVPEVLVTDEERADYMERVCAAWDFGILPLPETFELFRSWRDIFDKYPDIYSPAYHAFRAYFGWPPVEMPQVPIGEVPPWEVYDRHWRGRQVKDLYENEV